MATYNRHTRVQTRDLFGAPLDELFESLARERQLARATEASGPRGIQRSAGDRNSSGQQRTRTTVNEVVGDGETEAPQWTESVSVLMFSKSAAY